MQKTPPPRSLNLAEKPPASTSPPLSNPAQLEAVDRIYQSQRQAFSHNSPPDISLRKMRLQKLKAALLENQQVLVEAVSRDFQNRSHHETLMAEIFPILDEIKHAHSHVSRWARDRRVPVSIWFRPGRARIHPQPLGVVGIIVPWNYPLFLSLGPLIGALSAGNRAMIKMSENSPETAKVLRQVLSSVFLEDEVAVLSGEVDVARKFGALPFDHILFTGSTEVGRHVMAAAAKNLTPVTLELGGKSPALIHSEFPLQTAAKRITFGKCLNAGQTCIAPDYVLLPKGKEGEFEQAMKETVGQLYPELSTTRDYTHIITRQSFCRLEALLDDAVSKGARKVALGKVGDDKGTRMAPVLLFDVTDDMRVMKEEIFGPILPVQTYTELEEAIQAINHRPRPLALYYFDENKRRVGKVLDSTHSGGVTINDTVLHVAHPNLPFGGIGSSGMGAYHGKTGFETFSKMKPVFYQAKWNALGLMMPPYGKTMERLLKWLVR